MHRLILKFPTEARTILSSIPARLNIEATYPEVTPSVGKLNIEATRALLKNSRFMSANSIYRRLAPKERPSSVSELQAQINRWKSTPESIPDGFKVGTSKLPNNGTALCLKLECLQAKRTTRNDPWLSSIAKYCDFQGANTRLTAIPLKMLIKGLLPSFAGYPQKKVEEEVTNVLHAVQNKKASAVRMQQEVIRNQLVIWMNK